MPQYAAKTDVPTTRSFAEIERTLTRYGATEFQYGWQGTEARVLFGIANRRMLFRLPLPDRQDKEFTRTQTGRPRSATAAGDAYEQATRQRWRALALVIKAKLEAVDAGISTVETEFLANIVLPDGTTVGDRVAPGIELAYRTGQMPELLPGASS
jgi:hypothetical protein